MILGRGTAQTEEEISDEYRQFLHKHGATKTALQGRLHRTPETMMERIGKPLAEWSDDDIINLFHSRGRSTRHVYLTFLVFLFLRGYRQATIRLLESLQPQFSRHYPSALEPLRLRLEETGQALRYERGRCSSMLNRLAYLLAVVGKPLEELTRADFEAFRDEYMPAYRRRSTNTIDKPDNYLFRLERYLVHWGIIPPAKVALRHDEYFSQIRASAIRDAYLAHFAWCDVRYKPSTIGSRRSALLHFFLWLQEEHPGCSRLDEVNRSTALAYARYLKRKQEEGAYSAFYTHCMYHNVRQFYNFAIDERLRTSPNRNPFGQRDMPRRPHPLPRYLSDEEVRKVLAHCENGASLKEKTLVIILLHTGIRAGELAALKTSDIVQTGGVWKLHIHQGKGLKDRIVPLTPHCLDALQTWHREGWEGVNEYLFTHHGQRWRDGKTTCYYIRELGRKLGLEGLTPHRFRHTFAVALLNYGMRESALQKLMGHATVGMTLAYARVLDKTVELAFNNAVEQMQAGPASWVPNFFNQNDYSVLAEEEAINWIRLPHGYCRRHPRLHCESDVKCLLCDRYCGTSADLPRLQEMHDQFLHLGMQMKAEVVNLHLIRLQEIAAGEQKECGETDLGRMPQIARKRHYGESESSQ